MTNAQFILGFDLGTTNSVLAYAPLNAEQPEVSILPLPQLVAAGTVEARTMLPSFAYLANTSETSGAALDLLRTESPGGQDGRDSLDKGITGSRKHDRDLEKLIVTVLGE